MFKNMRPGMVIHCPTAENAEKLLKHLDEIGYRWSTGAESTDCNRESANSMRTCYQIHENGIFSFSEIDYYKRNGFQITEFSDLLQELTADELMEFYGQHEKDGTLKEIFGRTYDFDGLLEDFTPKEIVCRIQNWINTHEQEHE